MRIVGMSVNSLYSKKIEKMKWVRVVKTAGRNIARNQIGFTLTLVKPLYNSAKPFLPELIKVNIVADVIGPKKPKGIRDVGRT